MTTKTTHTQTKKDMKRTQSCIFKTFLVAD